MRRFRSEWNCKTGKQERIPLTQKENDARDAEEAEALRTKPKENWERNMIESDAKMSRGHEDMVSHMIDFHQQKDTFEPDVLARWEDKKQLRAGKPR